MKSDAITLIFSLLVTFFSMSARISGRPTNVGVVENLIDMGILVFTKYNSVNSSLALTASKSFGI